MNGAAADLYRAVKRDRHGDPVDADGNKVNMFDQDGNAFLGTIVNVVQGSISSQRVNDRQESSDGRGQLGFLKKGKLSTGSAAPKVQFGDRIVIGGTKYEVLSDPNWDTPHSMTGTVFPRYWVDVSYRR